MTTLEKQTKLIVDVPCAKIEWVVGEDFCWYKNSYGMPFEQRTIYTDKSTHFNQSAPFGEQEVIIKILLKELVKLLG